MRANFIDLTGQRFGSGVVQQRAANTKQGRAAWELLCDCGNTYTRRSGDLRYGVKLDCGQHEERKVIDRTGQRYGRLLVISRAENDKKGNARWNCVCDCGNEKAIGNHIATVQSCGCLARETSSKTCKSRLGKKVGPYAKKAQRNPQPLTIDPETGAAILWTFVTKKHPAYRLLIDVKNWERVTQFTWAPVAQKNHPRADGRTNRHKDHIYFTTNVQKEDGSRTMMSLHKLIMGSIPRGMVVGFAHNDYFDLRESQLTVTTKKQVNEAQRKTIRSTTSEFKGVSYNDRSNEGKRDRFLAMASHHDKMIRIAQFQPTRDGEIAAAQAYDKFALANYTHRNLNFPASDYAGCDLAAYTVEYLTRDKREELSKPPARVKGHTHIMVAA